MISPVNWTTSEKLRIQNELADCFRRQPEVRKVVIFGSFLTSSTPHDLDLAVFQDSQEEYLPLALRYRRLTRPIAQQIPLDILPPAHRQVQQYFPARSHPRPGHL